MIVPELTIKEKNEALVDELRGANLITPHSKIDIKVVRIARQWIKKEGKINTIRLLRAWFNTGLRQTYDAINKHLL
jgi:hypothetical protein